MTTLVVYMIAVIWNVSITASLFFVLALSVLYIIYFSQLAGLYPNQNLPELEFGRQLLHFILLRSVL